MFRQATVYFLIAIAFFTAGSAFAAEILPLQKMIDDAKSGDVITPPPGTYKGPIFIDKPITLDGQGKVTVNAGGKGSVIVLETDGATIRNMTLLNSGDQHNDIDSGIQVRGNNNVIKDNLIDDCLFGVDLQQSSDNIVRRNTIKSKKFHLGVRGDAIRLWYSARNRIIENVIDGSRDFVVWYSANNEIKNNKISNGRYGIHFMYAKYNLVEGNTIERNSVGVFLMYSDDVVLTKNRITHALGATGMGIGMKESSNVDITDNQILYAATGIYLDVSPFQPDTTNRIYRNSIAFNNIGIMFLNDWIGNDIKDNRFENNIHQVSVAAFASAKRNTWESNYWDDYEGFDRDQDNVGDFPYDVRVFADRLWMDVPHAAYFKGSPVLTTLDFLERLAPFTEPILMLRDARPKMNTAFISKPKEDPRRGEQRGMGESFDPFGLKERLKNRK